MANINMNDILSANIAECHGTLNAKFKKTVNIRQYESETYELSATVELDYPLSSPERALVTAILQAQVEYTVLCQLFYKHLITPEEFVTRRGELETDVQGMKEKAEELTGTSMDSIIASGIKPSKRAENIEHQLAQAANDVAPAQTPDQPAAETGDTQGTQAGAQTGATQEAQVTQPTPDQPADEQVQVTTGIPGMGAQEMFPGMGVGSIPGMGVAPNIPGVGAQNIQGMGVPGQQ